MPVLVFGLVAAGNYDVSVLGTLLRRLRPDLLRVVPRGCGNDYKVTTTFRSRIREFMYVNDGRPADKAIVVRDTHGSTPERVLQRLREANVEDYPFPVEFAVVVPAIESWLLADHNALTTVTHERGTPTQYPPPDRSPEQMLDPKQRISELLASAQVPYTEVVAARIAELASLERIEQLCRSFTFFKRAAEHC